MCYSLLYIFSLSGRGPVTPVTAPESVYNCIFGADLHTEKEPRLLRLQLRFLTSQTHVRMPVNSDSIESEQNAISLNSGHRKSSGLAQSSPSTPESAIDPNSSSVERLLASINDLLETRLRSDAQRRHEADRNQQMMSEWVIAAAALDRICFILFGFTLVAGSSIFALLFLSRN